MKKYHVIEQRGKIGFAEKLWQYSALDFENENKVFKYLQKHSKLKAEHVGQ